MFTSVFRNGMSELHNILDDDDTIWLGVFFCLFVEPGKIISSKSNLRTALILRNANSPSGRIEVANGILPLIYAQQLQLLIGRVMKDQSWNEEGVFLSSTSKIS